MKKVLRWLGILHIDPKIQDRINKNNMDLAVYAAALIIIIEICIFTEYAFYMVPALLQGKVIMKDILLCLAHLFMAGIAALLEVVASRYHYQKIYSRKLSVMVIHLFTVGAGIYAAFISYQGYYIVNAIMVFYYLMVISVCFFTVRPAFSITCVAIMFGGIMSNIEANPAVMNLEYPESMDRTIVVNAIAVIIVSVSRYQMSYLHAKEREELKRMTRSDWLTGLLNRGTMRERFDHEAFEGGFYGMILMMDMDDFQYFNDIYGAETSDEALRQVAQILKEEFGEDNSFRFGGDEFMILQKVDVDTLNEALVKAKITEIFRRIAAYADAIGAMELSTSVGYTYGLALEPKQLRTMLRIANRNLITAKRIGKNQAVGELFRADVQQDEEQEAQRVYKANDLDTLTGLPNMVHFRNYAERSLRLFEKNGGEPLCVLYFDVENFKSYNQNFGFQMGDQLLKNIGNKLAEVFRDGLVSRFSSDHFIVLAQKEHVVERIEEVHEFVHAYQRNMRLEIKAGVYEISGSEDEIGIAMDRAKMALDFIKKRYDSDYKFYNMSMEEEREKKQYIVDHLEEAMARGWIKVYFQPVVRTLTGEYCGTEALARWEDPTRGVISPADFIETLEEAHIVQYLDSYVLEQVCKIYSTVSPDVLQLQPVSVNLSRYDFQLSNIYEIVNDIVESYEIPKRLIHFEITESALTNDPEFLKEQIQRFHEGGYQVWMDDFGSGYSSLNTLKDFSFDVLKLDMMFLRNFETNAKVPLIISSIVNMAKYMGIQTLAEGVETREQAEFLRAIGCEKMQGYLFSKPRPMQEILEIQAVEQRAMENPIHTKYLDEVGRINLLSANPMGETKGWEYDNPVPMAIIEYQNKDIRYINHNHAYENYLRSLGFFKLEESLEFINDPDSNEWERLRMAIKECMVTGEEVSLDFVRNGELCNIRGNKIAWDEEEQKCAVLITGVDRLVTRQEKPDTTSLSDEAILLWLSTRGFAEILGYETYDEFLNNAYNFQADLTDDRVISYYFGQEHDLIRAVQSGTYTEDVERIFAAMTNDDETLQDIRKFYDRERMIQEFENGIEYGNMEYELSWKGKSHWLHSNYQLNENTDGHICANVLIYNIEEFRRNENTIQKMATTDALTGLANRYWAEPEMKRIIKQRLGEYCAMIQIDLDDFKKINDTLGHECGDEALKEAAKNLRRIFHEDAIISRTGGDEFLILMHNCKEADVWANLQELEKGTGFTYNGREVHFTYSVGYTMIPEQAEDYDAAIRNADLAMYYSKGHGKGIFSKFRDLMKDNWQRGDALPHESRS